MCSKVHGMEDGMERNIRKFLRNSFVFVISVCIIVFIVLVLIMGRKTGQTIKSAKSICRK